MHTGSARLGLGFHNVLIDTNGWGKSRCSALHFLCSEVDCYEGLWSVTMRLPHSCGTPSVVQAQCKGTIGAILRYIHSVVTVEIQTQDVSITRDVITIWSMYYVWA